LSVRHGTTTGMNNKTDQNRSTGKSRTTHQKHTGSAKTHEHGTPIAAREQN